MATYAVGDVQGCFDTLSALLERVDFRPGRDRVWLVGDLVNRGPRSLDVLRWAMEQGAAVVAVLGNHDLHLLARAAGVGKAGKRDTLDAVLAAPDRERLLAWLRSRPLLHREGAFAMVHAGLHPSWSFPQAEALAAEVAAMLQGDAAAALLSRGPAPPTWRDDLAGLPRARAALAVFARARTMTADGALCDDHAGPPAAAPPGCAPWFERRRAAPDDPCVLFGHWSALGLLVRADCVALDTGCVWGRQLTAFRLDDRRVFQVDAVEPPARNRRG
jgi:bis(5'-nucleosyl)-tetraphosphatase (symmetrical)